MGDSPQCGAQDGRLSSDLFRARTVFESVLDAIFQQIQLIDGGDSDAAKQTLSRLADLQRAYLGVKEAEKVFNDKHGPHDDSTIDFDTLRDGIGRKLDRLRAARGAGGVSGGIDA